MNKKKWANDIDNIFDCIDENGISDVSIVGHASKEGPDWINNSLALERAKEIRKFGNSNKVKVFGVGVRDNIYQYSSKNRRAEMILKN